MKGKRVEQVKREGIQKQKGNTGLLFSVLLGVFDFIAVCSAYFLALWMRFDFFFSHIEQKYLDAFSRFILFYGAFSVLILWLFRLYKTLWRYIGLRELGRTLAVSLLLSAVHAVAITLIFWHRMPVSYYIGGAMIQAILLIGIRFSGRLIDGLQTRKSISQADMKRVMLIGAGKAGQMILRDMVTNPGTQDKVVCIIDDDPNKQNRYLEGVPIIGGREDILAGVKNYRIDKIFLAIPSATAEQRRDILSICSETECELKRLPGLYQLISGQVTVNEMRDVAVEDLLGRDPIRPDLSGVYSFINGKTVLVTGGGGSIGSELCRQIAAHKPKQLIIFEMYENNAFDIQQELKNTYPALNLVVLIGSIRDSRRMFKVFDTYRPQIVYHAAAHKHVPLMEDSPCEAIKNNVLGTYKTAYAAMVHGCERFVLISTDKAVNPTNVMGASKRLCEMVVQSFDAKVKAGRADEIPQLFTHEGVENADKDGTGSVYRDIKTEFVAVRFGNVLGSNGSVIPLFKKQIAKGGPVTVTHPDVVRYFMTIPEAVSLVMLAGTYANGGEIFVLDMGSPVKIDTLARNLIRQAGLKPDVDIKIEYTGLRPGEKLYEEKLMEAEGLKQTDNELIRIGVPLQFDHDLLFKNVSKLMDAAYRNDDHIRVLLSSFVSTYHPANNNADKLPTNTESAERKLFEGR
ncbi:MAG: polysaccharide biosynthesis protein [Clostridia bacterium]|nr:polysaccharide biosynthesis protein [Clostridia bacterium]